MSKRFYDPSKRHGNTVHGGKRRNGRALPEYIVWCGMRKRCNNSKDERYPDYGGRGIKVCERWNDFALFLADMGNRPIGATIDRIDNDGPYSPHNCRWADRIEQANNSRKNRFYTWHGQTKTEAQWARELGMHRGTLRSRLERNGFNIEMAFTGSVST